MTVRSVPFALGLRAHSGWAAAIVLTGPKRAPEVVDRRRIELCDEDELAGAKQPYHAAEGHPIAEATRMIARFEESAGRLAREGLESLAEDLATGRDGCRIARCALLLASGRPLPDLASVLSSHALIHTADGEHYRKALRSAAESGGMAVTAIPERELEARAVEATGLTPETLRRRIAEVGKELGPPWTQDQKLAMLAAWVALAGR